MKNVFRTLVLIFFILTNTTVIYAQVAPEDEPYLNEISDFLIVNQQLVSDTNAALIPKNVIRSVNDVYEIQYQYEVIVKKGMDLQVMVEDLMFTNQDVSLDDLKQTFQFEFSKEVLEDVQHSEQLFGANEEAERVLVTLSVSMSEPQSVELVKQLMGGQLNFEVYFFAVQKTL